MRFVAVIMNRDVLLARISVDDRASETLSQNARRAAEALKRDANRHRSERLSDAVLDQLAEIYGHVVASQTISRESRDVTVLVRGDRVTSMEGNIAFLTTSPEDLVMLVQAHDDRWVAETEAFTDDLLRRAS